WADLVVRLVESAALRPGRAARLHRRGGAWPRGARPDRVRPCCSGRSTTSPSPCPTCRARCGSSARCSSFSAMRSQIFHDSRSGHDLTVNINHANGTAFNVWQAEPGLADHRFEVYEPGLHHVAFNVETHEQVDAACALVRALGANVLDGPG